MRCSDVTLALRSHPDPDSLPAAARAHLQTCASCARAARFESRFQSAWNQSGPASSPSFDTLWARVQTELDTTPHSPPRTRPAWIRPLVLSAQAAAVLVAITFAWKSLTPTPPADLQRVPAPSFAHDHSHHALAVKDSYIIEEGQSLILRVDEGAVTEIVEDQVACSDTVQIAAEFDLFNYLESL